MLSIPTLIILFLVPVLVIGVLKYLFDKTDKNYLSDITILKEQFLMFGVTPNSYVCKTKYDEELFITLTSYVMTGGINRDQLVWNLKVEKQWPCEDGIYVPAIFNVTYGSLLSVPSQFVEFANMNDTFTYKVYLAIIKYRDPQEMWGVQLYDDSIHENLGLRRFE